MTSSPGGRLGPEALRLVGSPADAGQRRWQVLPLGPPDKHGSPDAGPSAFAGWPGLPARLRARVTRPGADASRERHGAWIAAVRPLMAIRDEAPARPAPASPARAALIPAQDLLGLGRGARMNLPGRRGRNRAWRLEPGRLTAEPAAWVRERTAEAGRLAEA